MATNLSELTTTKQLKNNRYPRIIITPLKEEFSIPFLTLSELTVLLIVFTAFQRVKHKMGKNMHLAFKSWQNSGILDSALHLLYG